MASSPAQEPSDGPATHWSVAALIAAIVCAVATWAAARIAVAPGYATPIQPATGVALAAVLVYGRRILPAIGAAAAVAQVITLLERGLPASTAWTLGAACAAIAVLQAALGAGLVRRLVPGPLTLSEPDDVGRFYAAGALAAVLAAAATALVVHALGPVEELASGLTALTALLGDLIGVAVFAPVTLAFIAEPRDAWAPRRVSLGVPLLVATAFLTAGVVQAARWNEERTRTSFERDAASAASALAAKLQEPLYALEALRGVVLLARAPSRTELQVAARPWLQNGSLHAMGWSERDESSDMLALRTGTDAGGPSALVVGAADFTLPPSLRAVDATRRSGQAVASRGFPIGAPERGEVGVAVFQAVYGGAPSGPAERLAATRGVAFVAFALDAPLRQLAPQFAHYLRVCLLDRDGEGALRRLAGPLDCERDRAALEHARALAYAGRDWSLRVYARREDLPSSLSENLLLLTISGLAATVLLGTFLLTMTGRTRRIELAVRQRTAALEAEVSEREIAEAALRDSEQRFRNILDNVPIGVIYTNLAGDVIQANPRFCELTGYREAELLTLGLTDFTHPDDVAAERQMLSELVNGRIAMDRRHKRHLAKDGGTVWVQSTMSLLRDSQNQPWRIVGVVEDITEHLKLEEAEHAREAAEAANRAKSDFLSRMSHELRTPLNAMLGFAQLLELDQRHPLTAAQKPWVVQIQQAGWHLLEMINDVLDLSRIEAGTLRLQTDTLDLGELLEATLAMVAADAQARGIVISQDLTPGTSALVGDATRVKQILTNLLTNAVKYNHDGGRIHVASRVLDASSVEIAVTDTGLGMTPRQMAELFQPFNRLGRERTTPQGTGIGLVISQRLAELMGGSLKARSVAGDGSSFLLMLPRALDPETIPSLLDPFSDEPAEYHRRLVHYIEDNETNVEVMRGIVSQRPQVEMTVSIAGLDGLAAVRSQRPDLILLDMHLPDISGMELLRHLKSDPDTAGIPIVVVSADALAQQISDALEAGAERYLTKPVTVNEVLAVLDDLLQRIETAFS
jgi:PAS domain S-box-containing protein